MALAVLRGSNFKVIV